MMRRFVSGRGGRLEFFVGTAILLSLEAGLITWLKANFPEGLGSAAATLIVAPFFFGPIIAIVIFAARRLHDIGKTALLIPVAGIAVRVLILPLAFVTGRSVQENVGLALICLLLMVLGAWPSDREANEFGPAKGQRA